MKTHYLINMVHITLEGYHCYFSGERELCRYVYIGNQTTGQLTCMLPLIILTSLSGIPSPSESKVQRASEVVRLL